jgi:phasin family protein
MSYNTSPLLASNKATVQALAVLTGKAHADFEKLLELNLTVSRSAVEDSFSHIQALLGARDAAEVLVLQSGLLRPFVEQSTAYSQDIYALAAGSANHLSEVFGEAAGEAQALVGSLADKYVRSPASVAGQGLAAAANEASKSTGKDVKKR